MTGAAGAYDLLVEHLAVLDVIDLELLAAAKVHKDIAVVVRRCHSHGVDLLCWPCGTGDAHVLGDFLLTEASQVAEAQDLELVDRHVDGVAARQAIRGKTAIFGDDSDAAQFFASSCHTCSLSDICQQ